MNGEDEHILEFHVESIMETTASDDDAERVTVLIQLTEGGPIRLLLSAETASSLITALAYGVGQMAERDRLNRAAADIVRARETGLAHRVKK